MDRLISEQKVIRVIRHIIRWMDCNDDKSEIIKHAEEQIKAIPSVDIDTLIDGADAVGYRRGYKEAKLAIPSAEPKTGHWITWREAGNVIPSETRFECSVCHDAAQTLCNGLDLLSSYCPNCGARMVEPQESEDKE